MAVTFNQRVLPHPETFIRLAWRGRDSGSRVAMSAHAECHAFAAADAAHVSHQVLSPPWLSGLPAPVVRWHAGQVSDHDQVQVPARYARVNAWVISSDTDAEVRFLTEVFGAIETPGSRMLDPDGDIGHVEVELDDSVIMLFDAKPGWPSTPSHLRVYVSSVEESVDQAVAAGARVVTRPTLLAFGERVARVRDPQGHLWWLQERVEEVAPEELAARFAEPAALEAMGYVQVSLREEMVARNLAGQ